MGQEFDPITLEIFWRRLISIVDEAEALLHVRLFQAC